MDKAIGDNVVFKTVARPVDVFEKKIDGAEPLNQALLCMVPLIACDDSWNEVEGENTFETFLVSIDGEGNSLVHQGYLLHAFTALEFLCTKRFKRIHDSGIVLSRRSVVLKGFVEACWCVFPLHGAGF
jgi:hypothetical protein